MAQLKESLITNEFADCCSSFPKNSRITSLTRPSTQSVPLFQSASGTWNASVTVSANCARWLAWNTSSDWRSSDVADLEALRKELAPELRQEESAAQGINSTPIVGSIEISIDSAALPYEAIDTEALLGVVARDFHARLDVHKMTQNFPGVPTAPPGDLLRIALQNEIIVPFAGGYIEVVRGKPTTIQSLALGPQGVSVIVTGTTAEAEFVCHHLIALLWEAAGAKYSWEDFAKLVEATRYRTSTVVDFGVSLHQMLAPQFASFLTEDLPMFGHEMLLQSGRLDISSDALLVVPSTREIDLRVAVIDKLSGYTNEATLNFLQHTRLDANRTTYKVLSQLATVTHQRLLSLLAKRFGRI